MAETFIAAFKEIVGRHGSNTALAESGRAIYTYRGLLQRAEAIAAALRQNGIAAECVVGLYLEKSADYVASLLGVWLAGGAFVPLDPTLPSDRLHYMCEQASVQVIIHRGKDGKPEEQLLEKLPKLPAVFLPSLTVKADTVLGDQAKGDQAKGRTTPSGTGEAAAGEAASTGGKSQEVATRDNDLAYIIFTSGSTGRPKGVMVEHRGIVNVIKAQIESFQLHSKSQSLWYLSSNFDASVSDLGTALLSGATLHIERPESLPPGSGLEEILAERAITYVDIPPSVLRIMDVDRLPASVSTIVIGGEACAPEVVRTFSGRVRLINVYGPTEATICTSLGLCDGSWDRPLIGQPLPNISYHLLDDNLAPVSVDVPAQLYIGGLGLARGYAKREDLTASKFIEHNGQRLYRTGDLVVKCQDGEYQFLGRTDRQVKLRGMLIEPEEIEARLVQHPDVQRAAVLKRSVKADLARELLVGFILTAPDASIDGLALRLHLSQTLPKWMIPQRFEFVESLPLTVTGKVDLSALKAASLAAPSPTQNPHTDPVCKLLAEVWAGVLGVECPSLEDNFFDIGGDSFAVVEAVVAAESRGLSVPPALMLAHPTIGALARVLTQDHSNLATGGSMTAAQLRADATLPPELQNFVDKTDARSIIVGAKPANILLTGATGFLGARLLHTLLQETDAKIHCLVRAENADSARARIRAALALHGLEASSDSTSIVPICGDISQPNLGLTEDQWLILAKSIDTIFHSAAQVNMLLPYEDLRKSNVEGTIEIVRLMLSGRPKALHYASTLSVFVATDQNRGTLREIDALTTTEFVYGGYAQSKWAAEILLRNLAGKAGRVSYHRFGLITGDSQSGAASSHDFLELFVRGIDALGCIPSIDKDLAIDITPVDYAAAAYCRLALKAMDEDNFETYHIANRQSLTLERLLHNMKAVGRKIETVDSAQFRERLKQRGSTLTAAESAAGLALCRSLSGEGFELFRTMDLFQATDVVFDQSNALNALKGSGIECPSPSDDLIQLYLRRMLNLPVPARRQQH